MIQPIRPSLQPSLHKMKCRLMDISLGMINTQRVPVSGVWYQLRSADCGGMKQQLGEKARAIRSAGRAISSLKQSQPWDFSAGRVRGKIEH